MCCWETKKSARERIKTQLEDITRNIEKEESKKGIFEKQIQKYIDNKPACMSAIRQKKNTVKRITSLYEYKNTLQEIFDNIEHADIVTNLVSTIAHSIKAFKIPTTKEIEDIIDDVKEHTAEIDGAFKPEHVETDLEEEYEKLQKSRYKTLPQVPAAIPQIKTMTRIPVLEAPLN